jgi:hypothetical protein
MNVKLLRKIQRHILAEPKRYAQDTVITRGKAGDIFGVEYEVGRHLFPECGTVACLGGWAELLSKDQRPRGVSTLEFARKILGLTEDESARLFSGINEEMYIGIGRSWPKQYETAYMNAKTLRGRAHVAVRRIDHFIKTKGAE